MIQRPLTLALLALAAAALPAQAQRGNARVTATGVITDLSTGTPVAGALVEFPALRRQVLTDRNGRFNFPGLRPGRHNMVVSHIGFKTLVREETISENEMLVVNLEPDPIILRGIEVQIDRLSSRRRGVGVAVDAFPRNELLNSTNLSAADFIRTHMLLQPCPNGRGSCVSRRGEIRPAIVYIDERRAFSLEELEAYPTYDLYLVEAYDGGRMIRVYTTWFMHNLARNKVSLQQLIIW